MEDMSFDHSTHGHVLPRPPWILTPDKMQRRRRCCPCDSRLGATTRSTRAVDRRAIARCPIDRRANQKQERSHRSSDSRLGGGSCMDRGAKQKQERSTRQRPRSMTTHWRNG